MGQFWYKDDASSYPGSKDFFKFTKSKNSRCKLKVFPNKFTFGENKRFWAQKWCVALPLGLSVIQWKKSNGTSNLHIVDRGFLPPPPPILWRPSPILLAPLFQILLIPTPYSPPHFLLVYFFGWMWSFMQQEIKFTEGVTRMTWLLVAFWFEITDSNKHIQEKQGLVYWHTHKTLRPPVRCTQQLPVLHWMNNLLIQTVTLQRPTISLVSKNYSPVEDISLLIRFNKTKYFLWTTMNTDRNGVNEQKIHFTHKAKNNLR